MGKGGIVIVVVIVVLGGFNLVPLIVDVIAFVVEDGSRSGDRPRSKLSSTEYAAEINRLKSVALDSINFDRVKHGRAEVRMGSNLAAQDHAENMLANAFLGHWWTDGRKPYLVYSQLGGTSYAAENAAFVGFTPDAYVELECDRVFVRCESLEPEPDLLQLQHSMMYDDAHADWGHRDNILGLRHQQVSLGIAFDDNLLIYVQHFEGGTVAANRPLQIIDGVLTITADVHDDTVDIFDAAVVMREPLPTPRAPEDIFKLQSYCTGGGFSEDCGDPVAIVRPPLQPGWFYEDSSPAEAVAEVWDEGEGRFNLRADLGDRGLEAGVYTLILFEDVGYEEPEGLLLELSTTVTR